MKPKWIRMFLDMAARAADESHAERLKVGAIFVSPEGVMSMGINGMPAGGDNVCEYRENMDADAGTWLSVEEMIEQWPYVETYRDADGNEIQGRYRLVTKPEVSHAEFSLFGKLMLQGVSARGGSLFLTHSPCIECSKLIVLSGVKNVYYLEDYRKLDGVKWLINNNVNVLKIDK